MPFTSLLLSPTFNTFYTKRLSELNGTITEFDIKNIILEYLYKYVKDSGHYRYLFERVFPVIFDNIKTMVISSDASKIIHFTFGLDIIADYLTSALMSYTDFTKKSFDATKYFLDVYSKNVDVWGVLTTYIVIYAAIYDNLILLETSKMKKHILQLIRNLLRKYLYSPTYASKAINIDELDKDIKEINKVLMIKIDTSTKNLEVDKKKTEIQKIEKQEKKAPLKMSIKKAKKPRCPNGTRRNKITGKCETI